MWLKFQKEKWLFLQQLKKNSPSQTIQTLHRNSSGYKKRFPFKSTRNGPLIFEIYLIKVWEWGGGGVIDDQVKLVQFWMKFSILNFYSMYWLLLKWAWKKLSDVLFSFAGVSAFFFSFSRTSGYFKRYNSQPRVWRLRIFLNTEVDLIMLYLKIK